MDTSLRHRTVHGYRRAYRMAGSGPAVLLLHGIGDSSESWVPVMADLARHHTVVAPDLLGHGGSDKPRADYSVAAYANGMRDLLTVLGIESATVVGHSLGGGVAAQLAYQYPERCERLVLVASGGAGRDVTPILRLAAAPLAEVFLAPARWPGAGRSSGPRCAPWRWRTTISRTTGATSIACSPASPTARRRSRSRAPCGRSSTGGARS
jgi:pimeloyl-ACP methyl ester carboxylesterase